MLPVPKASRVTLTSDLPSVTQSVAVWRSACKGSVPALAIAPAALLPQLTVFALAIVIGYYVIGNVHHALHTPLMSVTNAISSVIVVGALLAVGVAMVGSGGAWARGFGFVALIFACVNIFGGFLVTQRMLAMYQKKKK